MLLAAELLKALEDLFTSERCDEPFKSNSTNALSEKRTHNQDSSTRSASIAVTGPAQGPTPGVAERFVQAPCELIGVFAPRRPGIETR